MDFPINPNRKVPQNAMLVIRPYRGESGTWVFDDEKLGIEREPFVEGIPEMIDHLLKKAGIANPEAGFRMLFSAKPFPNCSAKLVWVRTEFDGNWYRMEETGMEGWLCPALYRYFLDAPKELYVKVESVE